MDSDRPKIGRYLLLVAAVLLTAVGGYVGYLLYPRFDLPAVEGAGLLGLAAAAGTASFFSPCSFPLLVTLLGREAGGGDGAVPARPLRYAASLALGATVFMALLGIGIGVGGRAAFASVTFGSTAGIVLRAVAGGVLLALGAVQLGLLPGSMRRVGLFVKPILRKQARLRRERPTIGYAVFGFGYVLAGFG